jgi:hypothetical protein
MSTKQLSPAEIEANKRWPTNPHVMDYNDRNKRQSFIEGAKWQKEQDKELWSNLSGLVNMVEKFIHHGKCQPVIDVNDPLLIRCHESINKYLNQ